MGSIGSPETSVSDHLTPRSNPEDCRVQFNGGESLRSRIIGLTLLKAIRRSFQQYNTAWWRNDNSVSVVSLFSLYGGVFRDT
jgi:hypothetical protein